MLIKGDLYLKQNYEELLKNGSMDENPRPKYESDNVPAHTNFITQVCEKYDLSKGEYPFSLARRIAVKTGIKEVLAIYQGQQNTRENFEHYGIRWWEPWYNEKGTLGAAYPYNLESHRDQDVVRKKVLVKQRLVDFDKSLYFPNSIDITFGEYETLSFYKEDEISILMEMWESIIATPTISQGLIGVDLNWFCFEKFLLDLPYIPQFHIARENQFEGWTLTPNYYKSNFYSKDTCVFLKVSEEKEIIDDDRIYSSISETELIRKELSRNQLVSLIDGLKNDPFGRRHIISFWNWANIDKKTLVECAYETIWTCRRGNDGEMYVDMTLIQRSNDTAVAGNINKLQYCALMLMICNQLGYKVGTFCHFIQNFHIYDRHIEQVNTIMERLNELEKQDCIQPILKLNTNKDFFQITLEDFEVINYNPNPNQLKFELAI